MEYKLTLPRFIRLKFSDQEVTAICLATAIVVSIVSIFLACSFTNNDDWEHLHASWLVWSGKVPYRDFYEHHNPLLWYILAPIMGIFYEKASVIYAARIVMVLISATTWFFIYKICARFLKDARIWFLTVLSLFTLGELTLIEYIEIRPDTLMYMFFWSGLYNYFAYLQKQRSLNLVTAFILFTLSFLSLQKILPLLFILGLSGIYYLKRGRIKIKDVCLALPCPLLILTIFFLYLYFNNCLSQYFTLNFTLNFIMQTYYGYKKYHISNYSFTLSNGYSGVNFSILTAIFCILAMLVLLIKPFGRNIYRKILLLLFISELSLRYLIFSPGHQYFILLNVLALVILSCFISEVLKSYRDFIIILLYAAMFVVNYDFFIHKISKKDLSNEIILRQYIIDNSSETDKVFNCGQFATINVYRPDSDYVWFGFNDAGWIYQRKFGNRKFDLNQHILQHKPKFICTISPILIPYMMRFQTINMFNNDLYELILKQEDYDIGPKINFTGQVIYAYEFDEEILHKYYNPTPFSEIYILKENSM